MTSAHRQLELLLLVLAAWLLPASARAWIETRVLANEVRIEVDATGTATVEHAVTMLVRGGPLRHFDLVGADPDAVPLEDSNVVSLRASNPVPIPLELQQRPDGALRVVIDQPGGISRGTFLFRIRYRTHLPSTGALERDGAMLRLSWRGPIWSDGVGNVRTTFVLPSAPTPPRQTEEDDLEERGAFLAELRRFADRDEIELVRPHIARREQALWSIRFDPRALPELHDPRLKPPPPPPPEPTLAQRGLGAAPWAVALLVAFSLLVAAKGQQVARRATAAFTQPRPLIPLGWMARALVAGPLFATGVVLQVTLEEPLLGTLSVIAAAALTTYLTPPWKPRPRGPGRWLPLADRDAFAPAPQPKGLWLDWGTRAGRLAFAISVLVAAGGSATAFALDAPYLGYVVAFDAAVLLPIFGTGRLSQLPQDGFHAPAGRLHRIAKRLRKNTWLRAVAWARLPQGSDRFDELRLLVQPRLPRRGLTAIEVGMAWTRGSAGAMGVPQVLVRVVEGSPCHEAMNQAFADLRWQRGRKPDERVAILTPALPTVAMTADLALRVAEAARETERKVHQPSPRPEPSATTEHADAAQAS